MNIIKKPLNKRNFLLAFIPMIIYLFLFWRSLTWFGNDMGIRRILTYVGPLLIAVLCSFLLGKSEAFDGRIGKIQLSLNSARDWFKNNKNKAFITVLEYALCIVVPILICNVAGFAIRVQSQDYTFVVFVILMLCSCLTIYKMKDVIAKKPEVAFLVIGLMMGLFFVVQIKCHAWDEQTHYERSISIASVFTNNMLSADQLYIDTILKAPLNEIPLNDINVLYANKELLANSGTSVLTLLPYIPEYIGISITRGLGLPFAAGFMAGKLLNLLAYLGVMYAAIKKIPYGKILLMVIGLIPTTIFLAGSYAYDPWVTAWIALAFAYFVSFMEAEDRTVSLKEGVIALVIMAIGCLPKAIYFIMLAPALFIPKRKFKTDKVHRQFILWVFIVAILLIMSFVLPMFLSSAKQAGDLRGGSDVNALMQIKYVLGNPLEYAKTLFRFLWTEYLPLEKGFNYLTFFAYKGAAPKYIPIFICIFVTAFLDTKKGKSKKLFRFITYASIVACIVLIATALYVDFTHVALDTIKGCQPRYMIPLFVPFLFLLPGDGFDPKVNQRSLSLIALTFMTCSYWYTVYSVFFKALIYS